MSTLDTADLRHHVEANERNPACRKKSIAAINAYELIVADTELDFKSIQPVVHAAFDRHRGPMYVGTELLLRLTGKSELVKAVWLAKVRSPLARERRIVVACMGDLRVPRELAKVVIASVVNDRSAIVLRFAAQSARSRTLFELYRPLAEAAVLDPPSKHT